MQNTLQQWKQKPEVHLQPKHASTSIFDTAAVTLQQGLQIWEPIKAGTAKEKSSVRRRISPQVLADITSPSLLHCCSLWSHHEAPLWSHSLLSYCSPSIILCLITSTALLQQRYFLQLNICIPKSWHLPGQVPQSLHLMLLQQEGIPENRKAHEDGNQSDSSIWIFLLTERDLLKIMLHYSTEIGWKEGGIVLTTICPILH